MNEVQIQNILAEYADGFIRGDVQIEDLLQKYGIEAGSEVELHLRLAKKLEEALTQVQPSHGFVAQLRADLLGSREYGLVRLPPISGWWAAAGIAGIGGLTVAAGVIWWARRRNLSVKTSQQAEPALV